MHVPVMLNEVVNNLNIKPDGIYLDITFGCGGHSKEILKYLNKNGKIYVLDKDYNSYLIAKELSLVDGRVCCFHSSFKNSYNILKKNNLLGKIDGIIADLGASTLQLSDVSRGFSFNKNGFLDMRMDFRQKLNAFNWVNNSSFFEISNVLFNYGNEIFSKRIARNIINYRKKKIIKTSNELSDIIIKSYPINYSSKIHPATKTFQAIRIFINNELKELTCLLKNLICMLNLYGIFLVICFHSLEDKIIKNYIYSLNKKGYKLLFDYLKPNFNEIKYNSRSRSAIMRGFKKLK